MESLDNAYASRMINKPNNTKIIQGEQAVTSTFRPSGFLQIDNFDGSIESRPRTSLSTNVNAGRKIAALGVLSAGAP